MTKTYLILLRHGQSVWNQKNLFTGWVDIPLSEKGVQESIDAGKKINHLPIDVIFTSTLVRAHMTLQLALLHHSQGKTPVFQHSLEKEFADWNKIHSEEMLHQTIPVYSAWQLNERMYGDLQGLNKAEMAEKYGKEQVHLWRRSFDVAPPHGESLKMTAERTIPFFQQKILPLLKSGKSVFISAHGNSLRSIVMYLDNLSEEGVVNLELPTGIPVTYTFEKDSWRKIS